MNREKILQEILTNKDLKKNYWPNEDAKKWNFQNLLKSDNEYLKSLYFIFDEKNKTRFTTMIKSIKDTFKI
jgi:hypothetical protein